MQTPKLKRNLRQVEVLLWDLSGVAVAKETSSSVPSQRLWLFGTSFQLCLNVLQHQDGRETARNALIKENIQNKDFLLKTPLAEEKTKRGRSSCSCEAWGLWLQTPTASGGLIFKGEGRGSQGEPFLCDALLQLKVMHNKQQEFTGYF